MTQEPLDGPMPPQNDNASASGTGASQHAPDVVQSLRQAMRRARADDAERVGVQAELRAMQIARLELLQEALEPLLGQIPRGVDLFDVGLMPGVTPRLFIDMIGFVEMGRDARIYRLLQDMRHARVTIAESSDVPTMVQAITDYVARRLLERDKALAAESRAVAPVAPTAAAATKVSVAPVAAAPAPRRHSRLLRLAGIVFAFVIDLLGAIAFFLILAVAGWFLYNRLHGQV